MPYVRRTSSKVFDGESYVQHYDNKFVRWKNASRGEQVRAVYLRSALAITGMVAISSLGPKIVGEEKEQIPEATQSAQLLQHASGTYEDMTLSDKFSTSFIDPITAVSEQKAEDGSGINGFESDDEFKASYIRVGRSCLKGTAYDITPYQGDASAIAALNVDGDSVNVHAAGSNADPLEFTFDGNTFVPASEETRQTLVAYNCRYLSSVPVRTAFADEVKSREWVLQEPLH